MYPFFSEFIEKKYLLGGEENSFNKLHCAAITVRSQNNAELLVWDQCPRPHLPGENQYFCEEHKSMICNDPSSVRVIPSLIKKIANFIYFPPFPPNGTGTGPIVDNNDNPQPRPPGTGSAKPPPGGNQTRGKFPTWQTFYTEMLDLTRTFDLSSKSNLKVVDEEEEDIDVEDIDNDKIGNVPSQQESAAKAELQQAQTGNVQTENVQTGNVQTFLAKAENDALSEARVQSLSRSKTPPKKGIFSSFLGFFGNTEDKGPTTTVKVKTSYPIIKEPQITVEDAQARAEAAAINLGVGLNPKPKKEDIPNNDEPQLGDEFGVELEDLKPKLKARQFQKTASTFLKENENASKASIIEKLTHHRVPFNPNSTTENLKQQLLQYYIREGTYKMNGGGSPRYHGQRFADALYLSFL